MKSKLEEVQIKYFSYTPVTEKHRKLVLRSVPSLYTVDEVKEDIMKQSNAVMNVTELKSKVQHETHFRSYLVTFVYDADLSDAKKTIRYVCHHKVNWQDYRKPARFKGSQCFRCQRFGHVSKNCNMDPRCVQCSLVHEMGQCTKQPEEQPVCVNCGENHPASYKGCTIAKDYKREI